VPAPIQIQPVWVSVDLNGHAMPPAGLQDLFHVQAVPLAFQEQPACNVPQVVVRGLETAAIRRAVCACLSRLKRLWNAGHDEVEAAQDLRRVVERPSSRMSDSMP